MMSAKLQMGRIILDIKAIRMTYWHRGSDRSVPLWAKRSLALRLIPKSDDTLFFFFSETGWSCLHTEHNGG